MTQFKCNKCDALVFNEDAPQCPQGCGGRYLRPAVLIHLLVPSDDDNGITFAQVSSVDDAGNKLPPVKTPMVLACQPQRKALKPQNNPCSTSLYAVTCEQCIQRAAAMKAESENDQQDDDPV